MIAEEWFWDDADEEYQRDLALGVLDMEVSE